MDWRIWGLSAALCALTACSGGEDATAETEEIAAPVVAETTSSATGRLQPALISTGWPELQSPELPERLGLSSDGIFAFESAVDAAVSERGANGMVAVLVRDGHVASYVAAGEAPAGGAPAAADTVWQSRSLAAPVIATGMMMLYDEAQFSLDEPAGYFLPEGRLGPDPDTGPTIAEIMTGDGTTGPNLKVQAEIIEYISGTPVDVYFDERIFSQLGMTSMVVARREDGRLFLEANLKDMARFAQMLASGGGIGGARILDSSTVGEMATDHLGSGQWALDSGLGEDMTPGAVGRGLGVSVVRVPDATGPGASIGSFFAAGDGSFIVVDRQRGLTLVGLSGGTGGRDGDADVFRSIAAAAYGAINPS